MPDNGPSATTPRNEAAERLRRMWGMGQQRQELLDAALSEERRLTAERISTGASERIEAGVHALDAFHQAMRDEIGGSR